MKKKFLALYLFTFSWCVIYGQADPERVKENKAFAEATGPWFAAWNLVCKEVLRTDLLRPVEFVFFDDQFVYSTSRVTVPDGVPVTGANLMNVPLTWYKKLHQDRIVLPDHSVIPTGLLSFASVIPGNTDTSFFVMPLPSFWKQAGVKSEAISPDKLITAIFLHEFSHSQQMHSLGKAVSGYADSIRGVAVSDNIIQELYSPDSQYVSAFNKEVELLYGASAGGPLQRHKVQNAVQFYTQRQELYLNDSTLLALDDLFLTMEGLGQYIMYRWLSHPQGAHLKRSVAIKAVRHNKKWWSQEEGFALFLLLEKLAPPSQWMPLMLGSRVVTVAQLLNRFLAQ